MSQLPAFRRTGLVPRASGAAIAAFKTRAAAWEVPVEETPEQLSLRLWGCELRLEPGSDDLRLTLLAPEARLIGQLQDSATEILAEAGLEVAWDQVDAGALAPGLALMRVAAVSRRSPGFLRVRLQGPEAARFGMTGLHFRLLLAAPGRAPVWPRIAPSGRTSWPEGADALHRPVYTVAAQQGDWLEFDIFRHAGSPTCDWAMSGCEGSEVAIIGPGGGWCPEGAALTLLGDQTALPAITRMLDLAQVPVRAHVLADAADLGALADDPRVSRTDDLLAALAAADLPAGGHVWFAGRSSDARAARAHLLARGLARRDFTAAAYWD